jgi:hypothetical protein
LGGNQTFFILGSSQDQLRLTHTVQRPTSWVGAGPVALFLPIGIAGDFSHPEALAYIDGQPFAACDWHHQEIILPTDWCDGNDHTLALHGWTGIGGRFDGDYRICLATSKNQVDWKRHGMMLDEPNKDASLFPETIMGKYVMFHRRPPDIWIAFSTDLKKWEDHTLVMRAKPDSYWEDDKIGISGPPIKTPQGWFLIYHGVSKDKIYRQGAALLELDDPSKVIARQSDPILEPELDWEVNGFVPNVVFSCGQAVIGDEIYVYYGGADTAIGVATMHMNDIKF